MILRRQIWRVRRSPAIIQIFIGFDNFFIKFVQIPLNLCPFWSWSSKLFSILPLLPSNCRLRGLSALIGQIRRREWWRRGKREEGRMRGCRKPSISPPPYHVIDDSATEAASSDEREGEIERVQRKREDRSSEMKRDEGLFQPRDRVTSNGYWRIGDILAKFTMYKAWRWNYDGRDEESEKSLERSQFRGFSWIWE